MQRWENLQSLLYHLGFLGEELENVAGDPDQGAWLYRQAAKEAAKAAEIASAYAEEYERAAAYYADRDCDVREPGHGDAR